jgi:NAD(P)-dependent dehydrogenase (short-subunit alcohol dehydrogenase family)
MTVNLRSALWLTSLVIPGMAQRRDGAVILTASLSSLRGNKGIGLYGLSKAGVAQLARNLAVEWGPANVRVNAISPGVIATEFARPLTDNEALLARRLALTPLRRVGEPAEIAGVAVMLAARAGAFITGQNLIVDGGTLISDGN